MQPAAGRVAVLLQIMRIELGKTCISRCMGATVHDVPPYDERATRATMLDRGGNVRVLAGFLPGFFLLSAQDAPVTASSSRYGGRRGTTQPNVRLGAPPSGGGRR